jgi:hypothetical protein
MERGCGTGRADRRARIGVRGTACAARRARIGVRGRGCEVWSLRAERDVPQAAPIDQVCDHPHMTDNDRHEHEHDPDNDHDQVHDHDHDHGHDHDEHISYVDAVRSFREDKDAYFRTGDRSPIPTAERAGFMGLPYFEVDESLRFEGLTLEPYAGNEPTSFAIPTSDGRLRPAERAGTFRFEIGGVPCALTAYTFEGGSGESVFVPFLDGTSGVESYGAGRYLDLDREHDGTFALDFNLAYHPSCVYDPRFSCPLTPAENRLPVRIEAGERLSEHPHETS